MRRPDWPERLADHIEARRIMPFAWGTNDCVMLAADGVLAMTGRDPAAPWRGLYDTAAGADAVLGSDGLAPMMQRAMASIGAQPVRPAMAQRGDVALVVVGNMPTAALVLGDKLAAPGEERLMFLPVRLIQRAWSY